jgi:hypothetical protein
MKTLRYALLVAVSTFFVGCACKDSDCCKRKTAVHYSHGIMLEGSY